jgi:HEAT repeat protein
VALWAAVTVVLLLFSEASLAAANDEKRVREICSQIGDNDVPDGPSYELIQREALESMGERGRKGLLSLAASRDEMLACCALEHLAYFKEPRALPIARKILANSEATTLIRGRAMWVVARLKDTTSMDKLLEAFRSKDDWLKTPAISALREMGDERGLKVLREALLDPAYARFQPSLIRAMGVEGHEAGIDLLLSLLKSAPSGKLDYLGAKVSVSLARIGMPRSRAAAMATLDGIRDNGFRLSAQSDVERALWSQRRRASSSEEKAEIEDLLLRLASTSAAKAHTERMLRLLNAEEARRSDSG